MSPEEPLFVFQRRTKRGSKADPSARGVVQLSSSSAREASWVGGVLPGWECAFKEMCAEAVPWRGNLGKKGCALESMFLWLGSGIAGSNEKTKRQLQVPLVV